MNVALKLKKKICEGTPHEKTAAIMIVQAPNDVHAILQ